MKSKYQNLWEIIRKSPGPVEVRCMVRHQATLIQAVRKWKAATNVQQKAMNLPSYGMLKATCHGEKIVFELTYNGDFF